MAFCQNCGTQLDEGARFCPSCGQAQQEAGESSQQSYQQTGYQQQNYQQPYTQAGYQQATVSSDAEQNKVMGILAYLGPLSLIPYFAAKESPFARYHAIQGLNMFILVLVYGIANSILTGIFSAIAYWLGMIVSTILGLGGIAFTVLAILGIVNVCKGEMKPLPVIGGIEIIKQ